MSRCGTVRGYFDHVKAGQPTCADCRAAKREYQAGRQKGYGSCSVDGCSSVVQARGWCRAHLRKFYVYGNVMHRRPALAERFWAKVSPGHVPDFAPALGPCWLWLGARTTQGYGNFASANTLAHRFAYQDAVAEIPEGLTIDHLCMVRLCVNPTHLEPVTREENSRREMAARSYA